MACLPTGLPTDLQKCQAVNFSASFSGIAADRAERWFQLGNDYADDGCYEQAESAYREALKQGSHAKALHNLGLVQVRLGIMAIRDARSQLSASDADLAHAATEELLRLLLLSVDQKR